MKHDDVRGACLGMIKRRLYGSAGRATQAAALGWQLQNGDIAVGELAALCAAWIDPKGTHPTAPSPRWRPSPLLRAFFNEYRRVRDAGSGAPKRSPVGAPRPRPHGADRRPPGYGSH